MGRGDITLKGDWLGMTGDVRAKSEESEVIEVGGEEEVSEWEE